METNIQRGLVIAVYGNYYRLLTEKEEVLAQLSGKLFTQTKDGIGLPAVGDWVEFQLLDYQKGMIQQIEPRKSKFSRKIAGSQSDEQLIASNIDYLFVVTSLNDDFNLRRLERYFAAKQTNVEIVVVLTKADCCSTLDYYLVPLYELTTNIIITGFGTDEGIKKISDYLKFGKTGAFVGSSGVGKSTLVNRLLQTEKMLVADIRLEDSKGRHTTTHRELISLPTGGYIIDTPGMREFQLFEDSELDSTFQDIIELSAACRFNDCRHESENGCAVKAAIQSGELAEPRLLNYIKLQRELAFQERRRKQKERLKNKRKNTR
jgi:ribosome biogenesis GTPase